MLPVFCALFALVAVCSAMPYRPLTLMKFEPAMDLPGGSDSSYSRVRRWGNFGGYDGGMGRFGGMGGMRGNSLAMMAGQMGGNFPGVVQSSSNSWGSFKSERQGGFQDRQDAFIMG